jgi:hypothetical protein
MADDEKTPETPAAEDASPPDGDANRDKPKAETPEAKPQGVTAAGETFTKAQMEEIVRDRIKRDQDKRARDEEKARKDAVAAALKEQGDWQKLADAKQAEADEASRKVAEIEPELAKRTEERDRYRAALEQHLEAQRKGLPKHIISLLDRLDVADQLEYLAANADAVKAPPERKPNGSTPSRATGTSAAGETTPHLPPPPHRLVHGF